MQKHLSPFLYVEHFKLGRMVLFSSSRKLAPEQQMLTWGQLIETISNSAIQEKDSALPVVQSEAEIAM